MVATLLPWYQLRAELVTLKTPRAVRKWVVEGLGEGKALELKAAMTAAQEVPYRINKKVLGVLGAATARGTGEFGTPCTAPPPKAEFPFADGWDRRMLHQRTCYSLQSGKVRCTSGILTNVLA